MKIPLLWLKDYLNLDQSPKEIADSFTAIGLMLDKPIENKVLDLEQRLNRSDLLSILGCARDLSVFENIPLKEPKIKLRKAISKSPDSEIKINVKTSIVRRFNTRVFKNIKVQQSPPWIRQRLEACGIKSLNNIFDITNFCMLELGQPLHAQDLAKFKSPEITLRLARTGEELTTLLGTITKLDSNSFVLDSGGEVIVIGGIVGGKNTGVTKSSTDIILDAGNYDPRAVRTSSRKLKITNETVTRYDKPLDPRLCEIALNRATDLILTLAGGTYHENVDYYPNPVAPQSLSLTFDRLRLLSGLEIPPKRVKSLLQALGFIITDETPSKLLVEIPYHRTDLEVQDDLVSDILRMVNYHTIPLIPLQTIVPPEITSPMSLFEDRLRNILVALGAHEHITSSLLGTSGQQDQVILANARSSDQNALRTSILDTLSLVPQTYSKHGLLVPIVFELGKVFRQKGRGDRLSDYLENNELGVISPSPRTTLATLLINLGIANYQLLPDSPAKVKIMLGKQPIGSLTPKSFTLDLNHLLNNTNNYTGVISTYTSKTSLDLSLTLPQNLTFSDIKPIITKSSPSLQKLEVIEEYQGNLLLRLSWRKLKSKKTMKTKIIRALKKLNVVSRSESR